MTIGAFSDSAPIDNVRAEYNYVDGGSYTIYMADGGHGSPTNFTFRNNAFGRNYVFGTIHSEVPLDSTWENNYYVDTGEAINLN